MDLEAARAHLHELARWLDRPVCAASVTVYRAMAGSIAALYFGRSLATAHLYAADDGIIPHALSAEIFWFTWQPLFWTGMPSWWPYLVYGAGVGLALCVALGARARLASALAYLIAVCSYRWSFTTVYLDDAICHLLLFWSVLLPSVSGRGRVPGAVVRLASANLALIYLVAGATKLASPMWRDGSALWAVLVHPIAWTPHIWPDAPTWWLRAAGWAALGLELALPAAILGAQPRSTPRRALLAGAVALHIGIAATADVALANLGCLALLVLAARQEIWPDPTGAQVSSEARWRWREGVAALALALLCGSMLGASLEPEWRGVGLEDVPAHDVMGEVGRGPRAVCVSGLWLMGLAQQYRLLDWIDERNVRVRTTELVRIGEDGSRRSVEPGPLVPPDTRGVLVWAPLVGYTWSALPRAHLEEFRLSTEERLASMRCRGERAGTRLEFVLVVEHLGASSVTRRTVEMTIVCRGAPDAPRVETSRRVRRIDRVDR
jgi:hypothetical protein